MEKVYGAVKWFCHEFEGRLSALRNYPPMYHFSEFCYQAKSLALAASAYLIVNFFYRIAVSWRSLHKTAHQEMTIFNVLMTCIPTVLSGLFTFMSKVSFHKASFAFALITSLLAIIYPFVVKKPIITVPFFQTVMFSSALMLERQWAIWIFLIGVVAAFIRLPREEGTSQLRVRRLCGALLLVLFIGVFFNTKRTTSPVDVTSAMLGAIVALLN